jgi:hypothetical protein
MRFTTVPPSRFLLALLPPFEVVSRGLSAAAAPLLLCLLLLLPIAQATTVEHAIAIGKVVDAEGKPIEHAMVLVYSASIRKGFSIFCPTCYVDCGKRTFTQADGGYTIRGLSSDLLFNLLVTRQGFAAKFVNAVDPQKGPAEAAILNRRTLPANPAQIIKAKVVDKKGTPIRDALVEQKGAVVGQARSFGPAGWLDLMSVTDDDGEFEIAYGKPLDAAIVLVAPRAMAPKVATVQSGRHGDIITVTDGSTIRGRLMQDGKPIAQAEIGISTYNRAISQSFPEVRIGSDEQGRFTITNVPPHRIWYVYTKMESLASRGMASEIVECATQDDGRDVDLGDIPVKQAYTLRGNVVLTDRKPIPPDMHMNLFSGRIPDSQTLVLPPDGKFEFHGLGRGVFALTPSVRGYEPGEGVSLEILIDQDLSNLELPLQPTKVRNERIE